MVQEVKAADIAPDIKDMEVSHNPEVHLGMSEAERLAAAKEALRAAGIEPSVESVRDAPAIEPEQPELTGIEADRAELAKRASGRVSDKGAETEFVRDASDEGHEL